MKGMMRLTVIVTIAATANALTYVKGASVQPHKQSAEEPHKQSLVSQSAVLQQKQQKEMPHTRHQKTAGQGYQKGSPLYEKQEQHKKSAPPAKQQAATVPGVPPPPVEASAIEAGPFTMASFIHFLQYFIIVMFAAIMWMKCFGGRSFKGWQERKNEQYGFSYGLFSTDHCCRGGEHHVSICFCSWCCMPLRIADTWAKDPFPVLGNFWVSLVVVTVLFGLAQWTGQISIAVFLVLAIYMRQKMRKQYGMDNGTAATYCEDCISWTFCTICAVAQEARQSEFCVKKDDPNPDLHGA